MDLSGRLTHAVMQQGRLEVLQQLVLLSGVVRAAQAGSRRCTPPLAQTASPRQNGFTAVARSTRVHVFKLRARGDRWQPALASVPYLADERCEWGALTALRWLGAPWVTRWLVVHAVRECRPRSARPPCSGWCRWGAGRQAGGLGGGSGGLAEAVAVAPCCGGGRRCCMRGPGSNPRQRQDHLRAVQLLVGEAGRRGWGMGFALLPQSGAGELALVRSLLRHQPDWTAAGAAAEGDGGGTPSRRVAGVMAGPRCRTLAQRPSSTTGAR